MNKVVSIRISHFLIAAVIVLGVLAVLNLQPAQAQRDTGSMPARYTVIATEGHNLIVTDNQVNTLFFYTIDKDKEVGSELKLRGSVDLTQVGKPEIKPTTHKVEK